MTSSKIVYMEACIHQYTETILVIFPWMVKIDHIFHDKWNHYSYFNTIYIVRKRFRLEVNNFELPVNVLFLISFPCQSNCGSNTIKYSPQNLS